MVVVTFSTVISFNDHITDFYEMSRIAILKKIADYEIIIIKSGVVIDEELISRSKKLLVVGRAGTGTDNIDIQMLKKKKLN